MAKDAILSTALVPLLTFVSYPKRAEAVPRTVWSAPAHNSQLLFLNTVI